MFQYHEIPGEPHNPSGDTLSAGVEVTKGAWCPVGFEHRDHVDAPLHCVHSDPDTKQRASLLTELEDGLSAYTYLQGGENHE